MPAPSRDPASSAILAILFEAKSSGVGKLTRTALMKYLYLFDLFAAEESKGATWTGAVWRFHHFGPYSEALAAEIDSLASRSMIVEESRDRGDRDYTLYTVAEWPPVVPLGELGVPASARMSLESALREYANDLTRLLDTVYFKTKPMEGARPGDVLSFAGVEKLNYKADIRPIPMPAADAAKNARIRELAQSIGARRAAAAAKGALVPAAIRDSLYGLALASDQDEALAGDFTAELSFER